MGEGHDVGPVGRLLSIGHMSEVNPEPRKKGLKDEEKLSPC